jgi:subtilisin family serine protease
MNIACRRGHVLQNGSQVKTTTAKTSGSESPTLPEIEYGRLPQSLSDDYAATRGVLIAAAAGNQGEVGASVVSRHPWVISVAGCDPSGRPMSQSNFGSSIGRFGLLAPGDNITSLGPTGDPETFGGTSAATPFVSGTLALLWSEFPSAAASTLKLALAGRQARTTVVPPLLDAEAAYQSLASQQQRRNAS